MPRRKRGLGLKPAAEFLDVAFRDLGLAAAARQAWVIATWPEALPRALRGETEAWKLERGTLWVRCSSAALAHQLRLHEADLLERVRTAAGRGGERVERLRFSAGAISAGLAAPGEAVAPAASEPEVDPAVEERATEIVAPVKDPELRGLLASVVRRHLSA